MPNPLILHKNPPSPNHKKNIAFIFASDKREKYSGTATMNNEQFEKIFKENFRMLSNTAYAIVNDPDTAKDIVQHVMLKFWEKKEDIVIQTSLVSYLNRAVINTALNYIGKHKKVISLDNPEINQDITAGLVTENKLEKKELQLLIRREIDKLPPKCKTVFILSRYRGMSNKEIAGHLNISVKAVEKHISKALKVLRVTLKPVWEMNLLILIFLAWMFLV